MSVLLKKNDSKLGEEAVVFLQTSDKWLNITSESQLGDNNVKK